MSERDGTVNNPSDRTLADALRGLPDIAPPVDLWPGLARALEQRRPAHALRRARSLFSGAGRSGWPFATRTRMRSAPSDAGAKPSRVSRWVLPAALAAAIALAMLVPPFALRAPPSPTIADTTVATTPNPATASDPKPAASDELDTLHQRSQTLERWIAAVAARAPQDSRDLMAAVEVEDLIGFIDVQLGAVHDHAEALPLWRQRVALLEDLATIRGSAYAIAANDDNTSRAGNASPNRIN